MKRRQSVLERWIIKTAIAGPDECWTWTAARDRDGYGKFQYGPKGAQVHVRAHRWIVEHLHGPIPSGMVVLHTCDNPPCVNPAHLRIGTSRENNDDKVSKGRHAVPWGAPLTNRRKTECKRGHPFDEANTYVSKLGHRACVTCRRAASLRSYYARKEVGGDVL